ncbi:MAG: HDOD domain-containing protein [Desulfobacterales bacterium]|nr:HDOD domain-containing protein [Desulfobacterales bacterium]
MSAFAAEETVVLGLDETAPQRPCPERQDRPHEARQQFVDKDRQRSHRKTCLVGGEDLLYDGPAEEECIERTSEYERSELIQGIIRNFPRLPSHVNELAMMLFDEKVAITDVVEHAKHDSALVGLVLKTVNSAYYNLQNKISDFHHAVLLLGFNQIYQILIDNSIKNIMPSSPEFHELQSAQHADVSGQLRSSPDQRYEEAGHPEHRRPSSRHRQVRHPPAEEEESEFRFPARHA